MTVRFGTGPKILLLSSMVVGCFCNAVPKGKPDYNNTLNTPLPLCTVYDSLISEERYPDGKMKSRCVFNSTDTMLTVDPVTGEENMVITMSNGTSCLYYHPNGKEASRTQYENGKKVGNWLTYDTTGKLLQIETYDNDVLLKTEDRTKYAPDK